MAVLTAVAFCCWVMIPRAPEARIRVVRSVSDIGPLAERSYTPQSYDPYFVHQNCISKFSIASSGDHGRLK